MITVPNPLASFALARPEHLALLAGAQRWSAQELLAEVRARAAELAALGIGPGDRVALLARSEPSVVIELLALGWLGAAAAMLPARATAGEHATALAALSPTRAVNADSEPLPLDPLAIEERPWPLDEPRLALLTSGSTGEPRPVVLSTAQLLFSAFGSAVRLGHLPADRWLACLPLHHVGGLSILFRALLFNTTVELPPRFGAAEVAERLDSGELSLVSLVPAMLAAVLDARPPGRPFPPQLRAILLGGDAAPAALLDRCRAIGAPIALTFGMTEAASQIATRHPGDLSDGAGAGPPLCFTRVGEAPDGTLVVEGPTVGGRYYTRDLGQLDALGRVQLRGRKDAVFISGGENIAPEEIEQLLTRHPAVSEALVLGVPDARWGHRPHALLVARDPSQRPEPSALERWCATELSKFKVPIQFEWIDQLPRGASGKRSRLLAAEALATRSPR